MNKWKNYHSSSNLDFHSRESHLKQYLISLRKGTNFLSAFIDRMLLGIPTIKDSGSVVKVLDIGCGSGYALFLLKELHPHLELYGVDIVKHNQLPDLINFDYVDLEKGNLPFEDEFFDFVFSHGVVEHLNNPTDFLKESHRVLKHGKKIYIYTENYTALFLPHLKTSKHSINFWDDYTHVRPYSKKSLQRILLNAGFRNIKTETPRNLLIIMLFPLLLIAQLLKKVDVGRLLFQILAPDLFGEAEK